VLADIFDDAEVSQAIVHVGGMTSLDSVVHKFARHGLELYLLFVPETFSLPRCLHDSLLAQ
jgi:hypothetical protein